MCGIAGIVDLGGRPVSAAELQRMCDALVHRGPNDEGFYIGRRVGLGMRRLSIIDLETGHQPVGNEDGSIQCVFNGEIYNYRELRHELEQRGHRFYTATDTETIVHLYEDYGPAAVEKMRGMFAFAVWDENRQQLFAARDRLGIKPLYYAQTGEKFVFASELKAILGLPQFPVRLNWESVQRLFTTMSTPCTESIVEGVHKLEPGHILLASPQGGIRTASYWDVEFNPDYSRSKEYFIERLRELLEESVRLRLISDVPLGAFLSGGIDSSSIVAMMSRMASGPVKTFSIGFTDAPYDETRHARRVAEKFGTEHYEEILVPDAMRIVDDLVWYLDEPLGDPSVIPMYMVSKLASEHVTVVLSGDGGDELFAGYDKYVVEQRERNYSWIPRPLRRALASIGGRMPEGARGRNFLQHLGLDGALRYLDASTLFRLEQQRKLFLPDVFNQMRNGLQPPQQTGDWLSAIQYQDLKNYLPRDILTKVDRMTMAHSIEARVPLLDHKLVEFAATIPPRLKLRNGETKYIFKEALRGLLPNETIDRPKHGFAVPLSGWFRGHFGEFVRDLLLSNTARQRGILNPSYIEQVIRLHQGGRNLDFQLWTLISFELWCRTFLTGAASPPLRGGVAAASIQRPRSLAPQTGW